MTTEKEKLENMNKYYLDVKNFFYDLQINGNLHERAKKVSDYVERGKLGDHYVIAMRGGEATWDIKVTNGHSKFTNNGVDFYIGELGDIKKIEDFKNKVVQAINGAERKGGDVNDKKQTFKEIFGEEINLIIFNPVDKNSELDSYFWHRNDCYLNEKRNQTVYKVWIH
jgi:hypothetical protein